MDFVHEEQRPLPYPATAGCLIKGALEVGHAGEHGGELDEVQARLDGEQASDRGFAAAGRPPKDQ